MKRRREIESREIESLQEKMRRVVFKHGAVATLRQLVERSVITLGQAIRGVLDVAGNLTRPRLRPPQGVKGRKFSRLDHENNRVVSWSVEYSGGLASRFELQGFRRKLRARLGQPWRQSGQDDPHGVHGRIMRADADANDGYLTKRSVQDTIRALLLGDWWLLNSQYYP